MKSLTRIIPQFVSKFIKLDGHKIVQFSFMNRSGAGYMAQIAKAPSLNPSTAKNSSNKMNRSVLCSIL
jgi:hypothetical protein